MASLALIYQRDTLQRILLAFNSCPSSGHSFLFCCSSLPQRKFWSPSLSKGVRLFGGAKGSRRHEVNLLHWHSVRAAVALFCSGSSLHVEASAPETGASLAKAVTLALSVTVNALEPRVSHSCEKYKQKVGQDSKHKSVATYSSCVGQELRL